MRSRVFFFFLFDFFLLKISNCQLSYLDLSDHEIFS